MQFSRAPCVAPPCCLALRCWPLALVACQPKETPEQAEQNAESAVCMNLAAVGTALEAVGELSPSSTVGDAVKARSNLNTALANLDQSEAAHNQLQIKELQKQAKAFEKEVEKVTKHKDATLEQAAEELKVKLQSVLATGQPSLKWIAPMAMLWCQRAPTD